jgi:hypothetical protein
VAPSGNPQSTNSKRENQKREEGKTYQVYHTAQGALAEGILPNQWYPLVLFLVQICKIIQIAQSRKSTKSGKVTNPETSPNTETSSDTETPPNPKNGSEHQTEKMGTGFLETPSYPDLEVFGRKL